MLPPHKVSDVPDVLIYLQSLLLVPHLPLIFLSPIPLVHSPQVTSPTVSSPSASIENSVSVENSASSQPVSVDNFVSNDNLPSIGGSNAGSVEHSDSNPDVHSPLPTITTNAHPMQTRSKSGIFQPRINPTILLTHCEPKY